MRLFQAPLDTPLDSPFFVSLSVHGLHFTVCAPSRNLRRRSCEATLRLRRSTIHARGAPPSPCTRLLECPPQNKTYLIPGQKSRAAKRGGFKRGGFPIWTCPSFLSFFVLFCRFLSFFGLSRFFWDFPDLLGDGPGIFPDLSFSSFSAY